MLGWKKERGRGEKKILSTLPFSPRPLPRSLWLAPFHPLFWSFNMALSRQKHPCAQRKHLLWRLTAFTKIRFSLECSDGVEILKYYSPTAMFYYARPTVPQFSSQSILKCKWVKRVLPLSRTPTVPEKLILSGYTTSAAPVWWVTSVLNMEQGTLVLLQLCSPAVNVRIYYANQTTGELREQFC